MKRPLMRILFALVALCAALQVSARDRQQSIYMFAYGTSFNDSTIYLSTVEVVKNATLEQKTNFLNNRLSYSNAFKQFLDVKYSGIHTTAVFFNVKREKLEKMYLKIRRNTQKSRTMRLVEVPASDFRFPVLATPNVSNDNQ
jgi:hypothetical protein|uniref:hypothetical protein n=1 Tax=Alloprevotella sp. TaxID=1872471 RepID=UPI003FEFFAE4